MHPVEEIYYFKKPVPKKPTFERLTMTQTADGEQFLYLGYPLLLSPDEHILLSALRSAEDRDLDEEGYLPVSTLTGIMRVLYDKAHPMTDEERLAIFFDKNYKPPRIPYSPQQIAILVGRINRKAASIGGRKLIEGKSHHGYKQNPHM